MKLPELSKRIKTIALATALSIGATACGGPLAGNGEASRFRGGCSPYAVYAQNRWSPLGTAIRSVPNALDPQIGSYSGNEIIGVDGWFHFGQDVYPTNTPPWNSNIWFKLAHRAGYVDFAGVRGAPTEPDPTGRLNGGEPPRTPTNCEGTYIPSNSSY
ncbi:MAG: hypothetical protein ACYCPS_04340 [Candidatus Saccharimonadales bacterium]